MSRKAVLFIICLLCLSLVAFVGGCGDPDAADNENGAADAPTEGATYNWRMGTIYPPDHFVSKAGDIFAETVNELSDGRITVDVRHGSELGDYPEQIENVMMGTQALVFSCPDSAYDPRWDLVYIGFLYDSWDQIHDALFPPDGWKLPLLAEIAEDNGMKFLGIVPTGFGHVAFTNQKITTVEEAQGVKLRTPGFRSGVARYESIGYAATPIPLGETFVALQTGVVDGRSFAPSIEVYEMRDAINYYMMTHDNSEAWIYYMNLDLWNSMSPEDQEIVTEAINKSLDWAWETAEEEEQYWLDECRDYMEVYTIDPAERERFAALGRAGEWSYFREALGEETMQIFFDKAEEFGLEIAD